MNTPPNGWLGSMMQAAPSLPLDAEEGSILQMRGGEWVAVRPIDALRILLPEIQNGDAITREWCERWFIDANPRGHLGVAELRVEPPIPPPMEIQYPTLVELMAARKALKKEPPERKTAWSKILEDNED